MEVQYKYSKGLHILLTLKTENEALLIDYEKFSIFTKNLLVKYDAEIVGETFYKFENMSFTAAVCLKESHICIHTWPEFQQLTLDILLCNYINDNREKVEKIADEYVKYFDAEILQEDKILR